MPFTHNVGENSPSFLFSTEKTEKDFFSDLDLTEWNLHSHLHVVLMVCFLFNADFKFKFKFKVASFGVTKFTLEFCYSRE